MFGSQWELISEFISNFSGLLVGLVALAGGIYMVIGRRSKEEAIEHPAAHEMIGET